MLFLLSFAAVAHLITLFSLSVVTSTADAPQFYSFVYNTNWLGMALLYSGVLVGCVVALISDVRTFFKKLSISAVMFLFFIFIWFFINDANYLNLFLYYELFLLPSFFIVYYSSPNRRSILASIYFLTWTQFGSLLVLIGVLVLYAKAGTFYFNQSDVLQSPWVYSLILFGFGIKIPMWPFYYWLTKTHVEASSFFSIYLSGFLVKTAVYLFIKFYALVAVQHFFNIFLVLFVIGVIDASIKMWHQTDLKKLIAYTTVQEMNFLALPILLNESYGELLVALFIVTHCILSSLLFFYIDVITKRYNTRVTSQITGLVHTMPTFSALMFITWLGFSGLPFTIKFTLEIGIFNLLFNVSTVLFILTIVGMNVIGLIGFSKNLFNTLFGAPVLRDYVVYDLTKRELFIFIFLLLNLYSLNLFTLIVF